MASPFTLSRSTEKGDRLRGPARTTEEDLAAIRADEVAGKLAGKAKPGLFADAATMGLQRPLAGAVAALDFWNHPGTSMAERYQGGKQAYSDALAKQSEEAGWTSIPQSLAGSLVMGGPSGSLVKQGMFDAATSGIQSLAGGDSYTDAAKAAAFNALFGGVVNSGVSGISMLNDRDRLVQEL